MDRLAEIMAALLGWASDRLPEARGRWGEAIAAEAQAVPRGRPRLSWLAGGLWTVAQEAGVLRRIGYTCVGLVGGAGLLWLDWHPGSENPAIPTNRATLAMTIVVLVVLPWIVREVADNRAARVVRAGGYLAVIALLSVLVGLSRFAGSRFDHFRAFNQANWEADMRAGAIFSAILIVATIGGLGTTVLVLTSRRASVAPSVLARGAWVGVGIAVLMFALMPLGNPLHLRNPLLAMVYGLSVIIVPLAALVVVGNGMRGVGSGALAGLSAGTAAAVVLAVLTIGTMLLLPGHVDLLWANPDPNVAHGTAYEVRMSVGDAAIKYQAGLIIGPIVGLVLGAIGASLTHSESEVAAQPASL